MNNLWQLFLGVLAAFLSIAIILGAFLLVFVENDALLAQAPEEASPATPTQVPKTPTPLPSATSTSTLTATPTATFTNTPTTTPTNTPTITPTITATISACDYPEGWVPVIVQENQTLADLARLYGIDPKDLATGNCLTETRLIPGTELYVPTEPLPPGPSATRVAGCSGPPSGWVVYYVRSGDTLSRLAAATGTTVSALMNANCLSSSLIRVGQALFVPRYPSGSPPSATSRPPTPTPPSSRAP